MDKRYCGNCGHQASSENRICPNCGRPLDEIIQGPTPPGGPGVAGRPDIPSTSPSAGQQRRRSRVFILLVDGAFLVAFAAGLILLFYLQGVRLPLLGVLVAAFLLLLGTYSLYEGWQ